MYPKNSRTGHRAPRTLSPRHLAALALLLVSPAARAEIDDELDTLVVSALRVPTDIGRITSAVGILDPQQLEQRGVRSLQDALNEIPGVISTSTSGQSGAIGTLLIRGTTTNYSQVVVDGIRLSDSTAPLGNFLGSARIDDLDRIEVLRGPQSAFYGGEAVGGVVWLETARGTSTPVTRLTAEAGSFSSLGISASHRGTKGPLSWFFGAGHEQTENDRPNNSFDQTRGALRVEAAVSDDLVLGATFRAADARYENPDFPSLDHLDNALATLYAEARFGPAWTGRFTAGHYTERYDSDSAFPNYGTDLERTSIFTDHAIDLDDRHRLLFGAFFEHTDFSNTTGTGAAHDRFGIHTGWEWNPLEQLTTHAVLRWEDYAAYGSEITWRAAAAWRPAEGTTIRGGIGRSFRPPSYLELFGSTFGAASPKLEAEDSLGWDLGIEQQLGDHHRASLTWFDNRIDKRITTPPGFPSPPAFNAPGTTTTRGLEAAARGSWCNNAWSYRLSWTWLAKSILDQPDHSATASLEFRPDEQWMLGAGASYVDQRSYGAQTMDDFLLFRLYAHYQVNEHLRIHARVENLFDEDYALFHLRPSFFDPTPSPVPGRGRGFFAGLTIEW